MNLSVQHKVTLGVSLLLVLALVIGLVSFWQIKRIEAQINEISDVVTPTIETADDVVYLATEMQKLITEHLASEDLALAAELQQEFEDTETRFHASVAELESVVLDPAMLAEVRGVRDEIDAVLAAAERMITAHNTELRFEIESEARMARVDELGDQIAARLMAISDSNEAEMAAAEEQGDLLLASGRATVGELNAILGALFERDYPMVEAALKLTSFVNALEAAAGEILTEEDPALLPDMIAAYGAIALAAEPYLAVLAANAETDSDRAEVADLTQDFRDWVEVTRGADGVFPAYSEQLRNEAIADVQAEEVDRIGDALVAQINRVIDAADLKSDTADEQAARTVAGAVMSLSVVGVLTLLIGGGLIVMLVRTVTRPLGALTALMGEMAQDRFNQDVPYQSRQDEIGLIAQAVERFRENGLMRQKLEVETRAASEATEARRKRVDDLIDGFRKRMGAMLAQINDDSATMKTAASALTEVASRTEEAATNASSASNEALTNVETVSGATTQLNTSVQEISTQVTQGLQMANGASHSSNAVNAKVLELSEAAQRIGDVINLISEIAEQTNLLALNATIESARAGEAGKGFAVVASEVKTLAAQTAKATDEIARQITEIQKSTEDSVQGIGAITESINEIDRFMTSVASAVEEQSSATEEISRSINEAAIGNSSVNKDIAQVSVSVGDTRGSADRMLSAASNVSERSEAINDAIEAFLAEVEAA